MDRVMACSANSPKFDSHHIQMYFLLSGGGGKEMEPIMIKLHDLASPSLSRAIYEQT